MILRFLFGALTGIVLVASGMVLASAIFPGPSSTVTSELEEDAETLAVEAVPDAEADKTGVGLEDDPATAVSEANETTPAPSDDVAAEAVSGTESAIKADEEPVATATADSADAQSAMLEPAAQPSPETTEAAQPEITETTAPLYESAGEDQSPEVPATATVDEPEAPKTPAVLPAEDPAVTLDEGLTAATPPAATEADAPDTATAETQPTVQPEPVTEAQPETGSEPAVVATVEPGVAEVPAPTAVDEPADEPATVAEGNSSTFSPTPGFSSEGTITDTETEVATDAENASAEADGGSVVDTRPITAYAASFDNPDAKPVLAIVLIDTGAADLDRAALAALPFPVSFALDPMDPATPDHAAIYRAAGREVIMLATGIAEGSQASDVEVAFQSMAQRLPEAVAVMDLSEPVFQDNRPLASLVVPVIGGEGRGVLSWDKGLNAADQVARRDDIASAVIFRDLAVGGGDAAAAKRTLDRAVFKAGQDGRVVVAGEATPELIAGLLEWSVEGRAGAVTLGPLTAAMKVD